MNANERSDYQISVNLDSSPGFFSGFLRRIARDWSSGCCKVLVVCQFRTYYISKSPSISAVVGQEAICESPIVRTDRKGLAGFQGWSDRAATTGKRRCVTKRREDTKDRGRSREAFTSRTRVSSRMPKVSVAEMEADCSSPKVTS